MSRIWDAVLGLSLLTIVNPDHNKVSSLSNTTVVSISPNLCYDNVVYTQTWEVLTLKNYIEPP